MEYHDRVLKCSECGAEFVFTAGEQMFFADKGFKNEPKRCKGCKAKRAEGGGGGGHASPMRSETKTNCSQCGKETTVPFRPTQGRPVFCRECFQQRRAMGAAYSINLKPIADSWKNSSNGRMHRLGCMSLSVQPSWRIDRI
jgi:CxxC-x17-CxxC domain-containing protein